METKSQRKSNTRISKWLLWKYSRFTGETFIGVLSPTSQTCHQHQCSCCMQYKWLHRCSGVGDNFSILVKSFWCWYPTLKLKDRGCWWQNRPKPSSQSCRQHISSPTSVANIDVAKVYCWKDLNQLWNFGLFRKMTGSKSEVNWNFPKVFKNVFVSPPKNFLRLKYSRARFKNIQQWSKNFILISPCTDMTNLYQGPTD